MSELLNTKMMGIQALRGIAALLVAIYHYQCVIGLPAYGGKLPFNGVFAFGHAGVDFFFVLSGFIIFYIHHQEFNLPRKFPDFLWKRATRIYPLFLLIMSFYTAKFVLQGNFDWIFFLKSILLLPQKNHMLWPAWTLVHEVLFYSFFGIAIINLKIARILLGLWLISFITVRYFAPNINPGFIADFIFVITSPYNLLFLIGMSVAWISNKWNVPWSRAITLAGMLCFISTGAAENVHLLQKDSFGAICLFGMSAGILLLGLVCSEKSGRVRIGWIGGILGDISYPLYLIHGAVISLVISVIETQEINIPTWMELLTIVALASVLALLINRLFEKPVATALRNVWVQHLACRFSNAKP